MDVAEPWTLPEGGNKAAHDDQRSERAGRRAAAATLSARALASSQRSAPVACGACPCGGRRGGRESPYGRARRRGGRRGRTGSEAGDSSAGSWPSTTTTTPSAASRVPSTRVQSARPPPACCRRCESASRGVQRHGALLLRTLARRLDQRRPNRQHHYQTLTFHGLAKHWRYETFEMGKDEMGPPSWPVRCCAAGASPRSASWAPAPTAPPTRRRVRINPILIPRAIGLEWAG